MKTNFIKVTLDGKTTVMPEANRAHYAKQKATIEDATLEEIEDNYPDEFKALTKKAGDTEARKAEALEKAKAEVLESLKNPEWKKKEQKELLKMCKVLGLELKGQKVEELIAVLDAFVASL